MRPLTDPRPKPTLPVADRTLVEHVVDAATEAGATKVIVVVGYEADDIRNVLGDRDVEFTVQEHQCGTADAVLAARDHLDDGAFAVLKGTCCTIWNPSPICMMGGQLSARIELIIQKATGY
jgi:bifunctional UDP-N-acetylglucosamine pyrophosphorylase/glucosamine-1-phosphate N-acetyltransferase